MNDVDDVLQRLVDDDNFRAEFEADRRSVLKRFSLTALQVAALLALNLPGLIAAASSASESTGGKPI